MRKIIILFTALLSVTAIQAQTGSFASKFTTGIDIFNDFVQDSPANIDFRTINPGINVYGMYSSKIKKSNISLAIGLGLGMHNLHSNGSLTDSANVSTLTPYAEAVDYKINKLQLTYLDIPAEIRFKSDNGIRLALGIKAGYLISAHTKYKGDNPAGGRSIKIKEGSLPNISKWRFGPTFQAGYKWVNLTAFYSLSTVFEETAGIDIYPISVGTSLRPF